MNKAANILYVVLVSILINNCSSIKTTKEIIGTEIPNIKNWSLYYMPSQIEPANKEKTIQIIKDKQADIDIKKEFVEQVQVNLKQTYNFSFYENMPENGKIQIFIYTSKELKLLDTKYNTYELTKIDDYSNRLVPIEPIVLTDKEAPVGRIKLNEKVTFVSILIYNPKEQLIGEIMLEGNNIKPEQISGIIYTKILK